MSRLSVHVAVLSTFSIFTALPPATALAQARSEQAATANAALRPSNISVDALLQPIVVALLEKSPTFHRQWQAIQTATSMRVTVRPAADLRETVTARARTEVSHYTDGALRAMVEVAAVADLTELLPHEFEHLLEQLEGLDLPALADRGDPGVARIPGGAYETLRAQRAGRAALKEVYGELDPAFRTAVRGLKRAWRALTPGNTAPVAASRAAPAQAPPAPPHEPSGGAQDHKQQ